ncbi:hypothetical protein GCM10010345_18310 [Streptomyces canarius]|uniref:Uncharacterized protein n=1 Tax=Streptomyces canarius TaxID=285453 RepID=A0ABQ3CHK2_9ACTN|nr:hypothetical protein GCM10010345_18310 [Streptomyces canarius]
MSGDSGGHDPVVQAGVAAAASQDEGEVAAGFGEQVPSVIADTVAVTSPAVGAMPATAATRARTAAAAARTYRRRELMTSAATPEGSIALVCHQARSRGGQPPHVDAVVRPLVSPPPRAGGSPGG